MYANVEHVFTMYSSREWIIFELFDLFMILQINLKNKSNYHDNRKD